MPKKITSVIAVLGAGSWGTALAVHLAQAGQAVRLWGHDAAHMQGIAETRCNTRYLPQITLPKNIQIYSDLPSALADVHDILIAVPSHAFRSILQAIMPYVTSHMRIVWATKGLDPQNGQFLHEVVAEYLGAEVPMAVLSGPTFAKEVAMGLPTAISVAATPPAFADDLITRLHSKAFRVYTTTDLIGVQLGGTVKNILAIAVGIADGLGFGANARSALITRGLIEMSRLGIALGARQDTLMGLAGLGDLILTCTDNQSRNRRFGLAVGQGASLKDAEQSIGQVVEGLYNVVQVHRLAQQHHIDMPITEQVYRILHEGVAPRDAVQTLLAREPKAE